MMYMFGAKQLSKIVLKNLQRLTLPWSGNASSVDIVDTSCSYLSINGVTRRLELSHLHFYFNDDRFHAYTSCLDVQVVTVW